MTLQELHDTTKKMLAHGIDPNTKIVQYQPQLFSFCTACYNKAYIQPVNYFKLENGFKQTYWEYYSKKETESHPVPIQFILVE